MAAAPVLIVDRLTRIFSAGRGRSSVVAVSDVSLSIGPNQILGILGPNGAGKTTLIDLLAGVTCPTSGSFSVAGTHGPLGGPAARATVGYLPSGGRSLYPRLTAIQNIRFFASLHGLCPDEAAVRGEAALKLCGASDVKDVRVDRLSDGMVGRVTLARVFVHDPALLLLDEPMRSIDPVRRPAMLRVVREYANQPGKAVVMVTHDIDDIFAICDLVASMNGGRVLDVSRVASAAIDRAALARVIEGLPS